MDIKSLWTLTADLWPYSEASFVLVGGWLVYLVGWWLPNAFMAAVYHFDLFPEYKIQGGKWPDRKMVRAALIENIVAHNLLHPVLWYGVYKALYEGRVFAPLPSLYTFLSHILFAWIWADGSFYWLHRLSHHRLIYRHIHKKHHEFKQTIGIASTYAHPLEEIFVNGVSTVAWIFLLPSPPHILTFWCFLLMRYQETVEEHCGYNIPFSPWALLRDNSHHDFHHSHNVGAYGTFPFWDWLCGTDKAYNDWKVKTGKVASGKLN